VGDILPPLFVCFEWEVAMQRMIKVMVLTVGWGLAMHSAYADDTNHSFSYFELGSETVTYGETTTVAGHKLDMSKSVTNPVQRSGGYTPIGEDDGFYIQVATTLDAISATEAWNIAPFGEVQTNQRKVRWNGMSLLYSSKFEYSGVHVVGGLNFMTLSFMRSNFQKSTGATAFEASIAPTTYTVFPGSITEDSTSASAVIGIRYDSLFSDSHVDSRIQAGITGGVPVYYKVENSNFPNTKWVEYFQGYDVQANIGYAHRIYKDFFVSLNLDVNYKKRPETSGQPVAGGTGRIPEVTMTNVRTSLGLEWGF